MEYLFRGASCGGAAQPAPPSWYQKLAKRETLENPGSVEELFRKVRETQPNCFDGAKVVLNKGLSNHFQMTHTIQLGNAMPSYRLQSTYVGTQAHTPGEAYPVLLGDVDGQGNVNCNIIHQLTERLRCKLAAQFQAGSQNAMHQASADYRGTDFSCSLTLASPGLATGCGMIVANFLQAVSRRWAIGSELSYQCGSNVPRGHLAMVSLLGRYETERSVSSATIGATGIHLGHCLKCSDQLQIGVELETCLRSMASVATLSYMAEIAKGHVQFRASIDSNWCVCSALDKRFQQLPCTLQLTGCLQHKTGNMKVGLGLFIG
ncbi:mitochondrial import receptor subunit TOM40 homolog 1 [Drosophila subobscura]|uniref:mitochondrial import receptor subunit TOM40 homolog 1 n=1 Tax=Drosophila subobscura TaxID=7241 RepID=UPI00155B32D9|nr:mitochondrial import receptor subunit TOM40 homolog 1 [Drosophila subobscura]